MSVDAKEARSNEFGRVTRPMGEPAWRAGGIMKHISDIVTLALLEALMVVLPMRRLCIVWLMGLVTLAGAAGPCTAAQSGRSGGPADATATHYGIRDPLNPQQYMQDLAGRLNPTTDKDLFLQGRNPQKKERKSSAAGKSVASQSMGFWPVQGSSGRGAMQGIGQASAPRATAPTGSAPTPGQQFTNFWNHPSMSGGTGQPTQEAPTGNRPAPWQEYTNLRNDQSTPGGNAQPAGKAPTGSRPTPWQEYVNFQNGQPVPGGTVPTAGEAPGAATPQVKPAQREGAANRPVRTPEANPSRDLLGPLGVELASSGQGLTVWTTPSRADLAAAVDGQEFPLENNIPEIAEPWSLGADLDKYRAHAVKEGSRDSGESLLKAFERAGLTLEDGVNVFMLGYASDRAEPFRANDGKSLLDEPGRVPEQIGATASNVGDGLYSIADLILLNSLPDPTKSAYVDNHPAVRPLVFTGQVVGGVWKTAEEAGNAVTWGLFDNVTGCIGLCIEGIFEMLKHTGEAVTNLVRGPVHLVAGKNEGADRAMDWVLLVPLEFVSNAVEMKGISNMQDYETAFEDKGVIGSLIEFGGSSFLVYRAIDELVDELDDDHHHSRTASAETPTDPPTPPGGGTPPPLPPDLMFLLEGKWPEVNTSGIVLIDGVWTTIKMWR